MRILLARIDDRFIHGQVTVGWSQRLAPDRLVLVSDGIAADPWQCKVYRSSVPPRIAVSCWSRSEAVARFTAPQERMGVGERVILLAGDPRDMYHLFSRGLPLAEVNIGGMHYLKGKREVLSYVYVDGGDVDLFRKFLAGGVALSAQQVPGGPETPVDEVTLDEWEARL